MWLKVRQEQWTDPDLIFDFPPPQKKLFKNFYYYLQKEQNPE